MRSSVCRVAQCAWCTRSGSRCEGRVRALFAHASRRPRSFGLCSGCSGSLGMRRWARTRRSLRGQPRASPRPQRPTRSTSCARACRCRRTVRCPVDGPCPVRCRPLLTTVAMGTLVSPPCAANKRYSGIWHATKTIYREEGGIRALYRGMFATVLVRAARSAASPARRADGLVWMGLHPSQGVAPYVAINFTVYETLRSWVVDARGRQPTANEKLVCGALAGVTGQTSMCAAIQRAAQCRRHRANVAELARAARHSDVPVRRCATAAAGRRHARQPVPVQRRLERVHHNLEARRYDPVNN